MLKENVCKTVYKEICEEVCDNQSSYSKNELSAPKNYGAAPACRPECKNVPIKPLMVTSESCVQSPSQCGHITFVQFPF